MSLGGKKGLSAGTGSNSSGRTKVLTGVETADSHQQLSRLQLCTNWPIMCLTLRYKLVMLLDLKKFKT